MVRGLRAEGALAPASNVATEHRAHIDLMKTRRGESHPLPNAKQSVDATPGHVHIALVLMPHSVSAIWRR